MTTSITCPACGMTSHNPNDVRERYCGNCHQYHDFLQWLTDSCVDQGVPLRITDPTVLRKVATLFGAGGQK